MQKTPHFNFTYGDSRQQSDPLHIDHAIVLRTRRANGKYHFLIQHNHGVKKASISSDGGIRIKKLVAQVLQHGRPN